MKRSDVTRNPFERLYGKKMLYKPPSPILHCIRCELIYEPLSIVAAVRQFTWEVRSLAELTNAFHFTMFSVHTWSNLWGNCQPQKRSIERSLGWCSLSNVGLPSQKGALNDGHRIWCSIEPKVLTLQTPPQNINCTG